MDRKLRKFELADRGTIFLDEIGEMDMALQSKLLRTLQEGEIERVGGTKPIKVDVRIIAATNKNLETAVTDKSFREDLYYRLSVFPITIPPLRERKEDIPALVEHFITKYSAEMKISQKNITQDAMDTLKSYQIPSSKLFGYWNLFVILDLELGYWYFIFLICGYSIPF